MVMPVLVTLKLEAQLDARASAALNELPEADQLVVLSLSMSENCRNPSAVTWSKIKAARERPLEVKADFIKRQLDDRATAAMEALPLHNQLAIVSEIDVLRCRNPSAVVWSKIRAVGLANGSVGLAPRFAMQPQVQPPLQQQPQLPAQLQPQLPAQLQPQPHLQLQPQPPQQQPQQPQQFHHVKQFHEFQPLMKQEIPVRPDARGHVAPRSTPAPEISSFLNEHIARLNLDDGALEKLQSLSVDDQAAVLAKVNPEACRNPSAVVIRRIHDMQEATGRARSRSPRQAGLSQSEGAVAQPFSSSMALAAHVGLDSRALQALSSLSPEDAHIVMCLVSQERCKNPSAVAWSKIKKAMQDPAELRLEYLRKSIDEFASSALEQLPPATQQSILSQVDLLRCRNLSAVVWSKVKSELPPQGVETS